MSFLRNACEQTDRQTDKHTQHMTLLSDQGGIVKVSKLKSMSKSSASKTEYKSKSTI